jgi:pilus assembly protein CpaE
VVRDPLGFLLIGPPDQVELRPQFSAVMFRDLANFLVEKYEATVVDGGRWITDEVTMAALESSSAIFLVITQQFPAIRNAQRYVGALMRLGFTQDQIRVVVNQYVKKPDPALATLEQIAQTLNQPVFAQVPASPAATAAVNRGRPAMEQVGEFARALRLFSDKVTGAPAVTAKTA